MENNWKEISPEIDIDLKSLPVFLGRKCRQCQSYLLDLLGVRCDL